MNKNKIKYQYLCLFLLLFSFVFLNNHAHSDFNEKIFLSLRNDEVNVRQGPDWSYPVKFVYKKKYLPVILIDTSEIWRKVRDYNNNSGWIHISKLSKRKSAINTKEYSIIYKKPTVYSEPIAKIEIGRLVLIKKCKKKWCKISTGNF